MKGSTKEWPTQQYIEASRAMAKDPALQAAHKAFIESEARALCLPVAFLMGEPPSGMEVSDGRDVLWPGREGVKTAVGVAAREAVDPLDPTNDHMSAEEAAKQERRERDVQRTKEAANEFRRGWIERAMKARL